MKLFFNLPIASTIVSLLSFASLATSAQGAVLYSTGGDITVSVLRSTAGLDSYLSLVSPYRIPIASNRETGKFVNLGAIPAGEELLFELQVSSGYTYYSGDPRRNPDGIPHARVSFLSPGVARVGFEDLFGGGDWDFDDHTFMFSGVSPILETVPKLESFVLNGRNGNINILEGQSVSGTFLASDRDGDNLDFLVNNRKVSTRTPSGSSHSASTTVPLGPFLDNGTYTQTAQVRDKDGVTSQTIARTVNVQNVAPTLRNVNLSNPVINEGESASVQLSATDPGADSISFFLNNQNIGTDTRTSGNRVVNKNLGVFADNGTFTYTGQARDDDGGTSNTLTQTLTVRNVAPTLRNFNLSNAVINEGDSAFAELSATDPGADPISFFLNNQNIGTNTRTSGNRLVRKNLGVFADEGTFTYTGKAEDDDGGISNILARTLTVNNLDPTITSLTEDFTVGINTTFDFASTAIDPGINDILTFDWDLDGDGLFDDFTGSSGEWSFSRPGLYAMNLRVSDGDGGFAYSSFEVEAVPEPGSVLGLLTFGALGVGSRLRKRKG